MEIEKKNMWYLYASVSQTYVVNVNVIFWR